LRDRPEDIPLLAEHFIESYCRKNNKELLRADREALEQLSNYAWPGNVRELQNVIERAVVLSKQQTLSLNDLPDNIANSERQRDEFRFAIGTPLAQIEQEIIAGTLRHTEGDKQRAAQLLGISPRTIYRKIDAEKEG
jgi:DNA-binding NtrC family response regulator